MVLITTLELVINIGNINYNIRFSYSIRIISIYILGLILIVYISDILALGWCN